MTSTSTTVLITGIAGQIGAITYNRLRQYPTDYVVHGLARTPHPRRKGAALAENHTGEILPARYHLADLTDYDAVAAAMVPGTGLDDILNAGIHGGDEGAKHGNTWLGASVPRRIELAVEIARRDLPVYERIVTLFDLVGSTLATSETVPTAFGILALGEGDPALCARYSAAVSGDADTVGAMACAIAGARKGIQAIPSEWITTLESVNNQYDFRGTARGLAQLAWERLQ